MKLERVPTGVEGFDKLVSGGIPKNSIVLVSGSAGSGKTLFGLQFLHNGATKFGEKGLYVSVEESPENLKLSAAQMSWDFEALEKQGKTKIEHFRVTKTHVGRILTAIDEAITEFKPDRLVIDSISILGVYSELITSAEVLSDLGIEIKKEIVIPTGEIVTRRAVMTLIEKLREHEITTLLISELPQQSVWLSRDTVSEFMVDGIVRLDRTELPGENLRSLVVAKMRKTPIDAHPRPLEITSEGIVVYETEKVYRK